MAHSIFHFSVGLAIGTAGFLPGVIKALKSGTKVSPAVARWLILSYGLAAAAVVPNLLRRLGLPEPVVSGWWMNLFVFHPLIDRLKQGGMLFGEVIIAACFTLQYALILVMLGKTLRRKRILPDGQT